MIVKLFMTFPFHTLRKTRRTPSTARYPLPKDAAVDVWHDQSPISWRDLIVMAE